MSHDIASDRIRLKYLTILTDVCGENLSFRELPTAKQSQICRRIERSCYNKIVTECSRLYISRFWNNPSFLQRYSTEMYRMCVNLNKSSYFIDKLMSGEFSPSMAANYTNEEICPSASESERLFIDKRRAQKVIEKYTDKYPCKKCGSKKVKYIEIMRSLGADEITSFKFTCNDCASTW